MAIKITWQTPEDVNITQLEISRSRAKYGTYSVISTISATSDGLPKSVSNTWVTFYIDTDGVTSDWYKIRLLDTTNSVWSEFSDPITGNQEVKLCSIDEIKRVFNTVGRWTDDEIFNAMIEIEDEMYVEMGQPMAAIYSEIGLIDNTLQNRYYVGEENIHRVDRVFYGTTTKVEVFLDDGYKQNRKYGMVEILPYASSGVTLDSECEIEIQYVPRIFNRVAVYRVAKRLLEQSDLTSAGKPSKELEAIERRLKDVENILANKYCMLASTSVKYYDKAYGVNRKYLLQDHRRNAYVGSTGW